MQSTWHLYMLECADGSVYTGIATDVEARYAKHAAGKGAKYTRARKPVSILRTVPFPDRASASKEEYRIKQMTPRQKWALCKKT